MSVATSMYDAEDMVLVLGTKQWISLSNALEELNVPVSTATMFCVNMAVNRQCLQ
jgi:hypothetical protein